MSEAGVTPLMAKSSSSVGKEEIRKVSVPMSRNKTMPVTRAEYEIIQQRKRRAEYDQALPEWKLHCLCSEYSLPPTIKGQLMGCF